MPAKARVGDLEIAYDDVGAGGRAFVLVHGFCGSRDDFADVLEPLGAVGRTLVPDLRGHGGTSNPGTGYTLDQLSLDLLGFLDAIGLERCDLLGHSLGGMVSLRFALAHPERVASLVLMDTAAREPGATPQRHALIGAVGRRVPLRWFGSLVRMNRRFLPEPMRRAEARMGADRYWERLRRKLDAVDPIGFGELMRTIAEQVPVTDRLAEIRCPSLVVVGELDAGMREASDELARGLPNAKLVVIEDAHHSPQIEAPERWLAEIRAHLARTR